MKPSQWCFCLLFLTVACGSGSGLDENSSTQGDSTQESQSTPHPKLEKFVTSDLLGGMFGVSAHEMESIILEPKPSETSVGKLSINLEPPVEPKLLNSNPFVIDSSFVFVGSGGSGRMTLSAAGTGEENDVIRHFAPLTLRFIFAQYAFENVCLGAVRVSGEVHCDIDGDYELKTEQFLGKAHCISGPKGDPKPILYSENKTSHEVVLDAVLTIKGDPFSFDSYQYEGEITIDGVKRKIEDLFKEDNSCS